MTLLPPESFLTEEELKLLRQCDSQLRRLHEERQPLEAKARAREHTAKDVEDLQRLNGEITRLDAERKRLLDKNLLLAKNQGPRNL